MMKNIKKTATLLGLSLMVSAPLFAASNSASMTDSAINSAVMSQLASDPITASSHITANTMNGNVTLMGTVKTDNQVDTAVQNAESVMGVKDVDSKLIVPNSTQPMSDTVITAKIKGLYLREKVFGDKPISVTGVSIETQNGVVNLSGHVDNRAQMHQAIKLAKSVKGVKKVVSKIQMMSSSK